MNNFKLANERGHNMWLVSAKTGKLKRLRIFRSYILLIVLAFVLVFAFSFRGFLGYLSDSVFAATATDKVLLKAHQDLKAKLVRLEDEKTEVARYHGRIIKKLENLKNVLKSASDLGLVEQSKVELSSAKKLGQGGPEFDCEILGTCAKVVNAKLDVEGIINLREVKGEITPQKTLALVSHYNAIVNHLPIILPVSGGRITSNYGVRKSPFTKRTTMHQGIDIADSYGSLVIAPANGVVSKVKWTGAYGLMIEVEHGNRLVTRYAHLSKALVKPGQKVTRFDNLGKIGTSGRSTGPHLHYEVTVDGKRVNPKKLIELGKSIQEAL